jgi:hypothetical protein
MIFIKNITTIREKHPLPRKKPQQPTPQKPHFQEQSWVSSKQLQQDKKNTEHTVPSLTTGTPNSFQNSLGNLDTRNRLSVNGLLDVRVHLDHVLVQLWVLAHHDLRIPRGSNENGLNTALQRRGEAIGDLQADEEGICDDDGSELALRIVGWVCEDEVEVCEAVGEIC